MEFSFSDSSKMAGNSIGMLRSRHGPERLDGDIARMKTLFLIAAGMFCCP